MIIDGDKLIEALGLPSHDKRVLSLLKELNLKRPMKDENYDEVSIMEVTKDKQIQFTFDERCKTEKQKSGFYGNVDFYLNRIIVFGKEGIVAPPLGIEWGDNYNHIEKVLGKKADYKNEYIPEKRSWILEDANKVYFLNIVFNNEKLEKIVNFSFGNYNTDANYTMPINND